MSWTIQLAIFVFIGGTLAAISSLNKRQEFRQYTCILTQEFEPADCRLSFMSKDDDLTTITDSGCFIEKDKSQFVRNFCPLQCKNAKYAYVLAQRPELNSACVLDESYGVMKRKQDWFLWRSISCAVSEVQFDIGCIHSPIPTTNTNSTDDFEGSGF
ncbi:hypothetical protein M3Y94_00969200 [Aphelenchoides besseyi]|nr:hypothetical protein M3Y94_00969200 [Aphelenchoides besseyi]KAI6224635.1 hypothetical protein M3Y95_00773700 [Aphelenchoides besseyi]